MYPYHTCMLSCQACALGSYPRQVCSQDNLNYQFAEALLCCCSCGWYYPGGCRGSAYGWSYSRGSTHSWKEAALAGAIEGELQKYIVVFLVVILSTVKYCCVYSVICLAYVCSLMLSCQACATCQGSCPRQACLQGNSPQLPLTCLFHCCRSGCNGSSVC